MLYSHSRLPSGLLLPGMMGAFARPQGGGGGGAGDEHLDAVRLLLHFDGDFVNSAPTSPFTLTEISTPTTTTTEKKFGTASYVGASGSVRVDDGQWTLGGDDFTIECWVKFNGLGGDQCILGRNNSSPLWRKNTVTNTMRFVFNASVAFNSVGTVTSGVWYHLAVTREGGAIRQWINGVKDGESTGNEAQTQTNNANFGIGSNTGSATSESIDGWIDEFRYTAGVARYTGNFTPPESAFPDE